jgi:spermidine synthase
MRLRERLWNPYVIVFLSNASIMVLELVASRLIAPQLGVSLYTWTSVIGVILAGISLGNYIGGRLADRSASYFLLGLIFILASLGSLSILWLINNVGDVTLPQNVPLMVWVVGYIAAIFFLPSAILGCISPIVVKLSLTDLERTGRTVGKIYAWSSVGSIVGTFATGFYLISWFGTRTIVLMVAAVLMLMGIWFATAGRGKGVVIALVAVFFSLGAVGSLAQANYLSTDCLRETNYFCIKVHEKEVGNRQVRELVLDRLVHSYSDIEDPAFLHYGYEQTYAQVIAPLMEHKPDLSAMFIGGGGYTFPRYLEAKLPDSHIVVAEIDPEVTEVAHAMLGLSRNTRVQIANQDARIYLELNGQPDSYDLVFGDAFNDYSVPSHLTTLEFDQLVDKILREDGLYVINIIDGGKRGHFMRAYIHTLQQVFPHVAVIPSGGDWESSVRTTFVVVASKQPLQLDHLPVSETPLASGYLEAYLNMEEPLILTDDYVPVDNLLAPVFADSHRG